MHASDTRPTRFREKDTKSQESSVVARINQHENKQSYNLKKLLMKAINKAFYKSAVHTHLHTPKRQSTWPTCVSHQMPEWLLFTHCEPFHFILPLSRSYFRSHLALFSKFFPPARWPSSQAQPSLYTHPLTHSLVLSFHSFSQKGSDCYYSYIQITYILKLLLLLLLLLLCMTKIQNDNTHTHSRAQSICIQNNRRRNIVTKAR